MFVRRNRFVIGVALVWAFGWVWTGETLAQDAGFLTALEVRGAVTVSDAAGAAKALKAQDRVELGSKIEVGANAFCKVGVDAEGQKKIWIQENSSFVFSSNENEPGKMQLLTGTLVANIKGLKEGETFAVESPLAIASVRGSGFLVAAAGHFSSFEHTLFIQASSGELLELAQGYSVDLGGDGHFSQPQKTLEPEKKLWEEWDSGAVVIQDGTQADEADSVAILDVHKGYYMGAKCQSAEACEGGDEEKENRKRALTGGKGKKKAHKKAERMQDMQMMIGDAAKLPVRVQLPKSDSSIRIAVGPDTVVELSGVMLACLEKDPASGSLKAKIFQAARYTAQVEYREGQTIIKIVSGNSRQLSKSRVRVSEGSVRYSMPDLCASCFSESETLVAAGECMEEDMTQPDDETWDEFDQKPPSDFDSAQQNLPYR